MAGKQTPPETGNSGQVVAVTGTNEFLGKNLIERLENDPRYRMVLALDVREPVAAGRKTVFCPADLTSPEAGQELAELFRSHRVDSLVHLAFLSHPVHDTSYAHELQVIGTMHTLNAAAAARVKKVVMLGSTMSYGARPDNPNFLREEDPLRGIDGCPILNDLVEVEGQLRQFSMKHPKVVTTILRMGCLLGSRVDGLILRLLSRSTVPTVMGYDPLLQFLHESDAMDALKLAVDQDQRGAYNIVAPGVLPLSTVLRLGGRLGVPIPHFLWEKVGGLLWIFQALEFPVSFVDFLRFLWVADGEKAERKMGFTPQFSTRQAWLDYSGTSGRIGT
jgi:UDP-glucose 4-epimerase